MTPEARAREIAKGCQHAAKSLHPVENRDRFACADCIAAALDEANNEVVRLREREAALVEALRGLLSLIADEDSGDGKGELIRDISRDDAPDYVHRMMRLVKILATAHALARPEER